MLRLRFLFAFLISTPLAAQSGESLNLVMHKGSGRIVLPADMSLDLIALYDKGERPVAQFTDKKTGVEASYLAFPNLSGTPTAGGCRADVIAPLLKRFGDGLINVDTSGRAEGSEWAYASYMVKTFQGVNVRQQNQFAFAGDAHTCLEVHVSKTDYKPADLPAMTARIASTKTELEYTPTIKDYFMMASLLFKSDPGAAAPYYRQVLALTPPGPATLRPRRVVTDQLAMALGMSGQVAESRKVLEAAVASDADYALNYYNLACADAEEGDAAKAKVHLQQAFDRRRNMEKGEQLPDPTKDDSLLKLKKDKAFWELATSLSQGRIAC